MNINFLRKRNLKLNKFQKQDKTIFNYVLIYFSIATIITIGLLSTEIFFNSRLKSIKKQQDRVKNKITNSEDLELEFLFFANKLKFIKQIFEKRSDKQAAINYFSNLFSDQIYIDGIEYDGKGTTLSLRVKGTNVFYLEEVFSKLESDEVKQEFASLSKSGLRRNEDGSYNMNLIIGLRQGTNNTLSNE